MIWDGFEMLLNNTLTHTNKSFFFHSPFYFLLLSFRIKICICFPILFTYSSTLSITQSVVHIYWVKIITEKSPKLFYCQLYFAFLIRENILRELPHVVDTTIWIFLIPGSWSTWDRFNFSSHMDTSLCLRKILPYTCVKTR